MSRALCVILLGKLFCVGPVQEGDHMLAQAGAVGVELAAAGAHGDLVLHCPQNGRSVKGLSMVASGLPSARHRKVTNWARVTLALGEKWVLSVPMVTPFSAAQRIAL